MGHPCSRQSSVTRSVFGGVNDGLGERGHAAGSFPTAITERSPSTRSDITGSAGSVSWPALSACRHAISRRTRSCRGLPTARRSYASSLLRSWLNCWRHPRHGSSHVPSQICWRAMVTKQPIIASRSNRLSRPPSGEARNPVFRKTALPFREVVRSRKTVL